MSSRGSCTEVGPKSLTIGAVQSIIFVCISYRMKLIVLFLVCDLAVNANFVNFVITKGDRNESEVGGKMKRQIAPYRRQRY